MGMLSFEDPDNLRDIETEDSLEVKDIFEETTLDVEAVDFLLLLDVSSKKEVSEGILKALRSNSICVCGAGC